ncbi:MAG: hypothetical protein FJW20_18080 [Acidimicrobiia bacterium]|nr:hypothetical protein [Acidimicrobiia bacterium]
MLSPGGRWLLAGLIACASLSGSQMELRIRLTEPLRSDQAAPGRRFRAAVVTALAPKTGMRIAPGALIHGVVENLKPVGIGLRRDRAWMRLKIDGYELGDGRIVPLEAQLLEVENAREEVTAEGRVRGIAAATHAYSFLQGMWYQPRAGLVARSAGGLTGATGRITSRYALGPLGAASLGVVRLVLLRFPESEIVLPAGTELRIAVKGLPEDVPLASAEEADPEAAGMGEALRGLDFRVAKPGGKLADDIVHLAFLGTREQVEKAFQRAGWVAADPLTPRSFARAYQAYTSMRGYPAAPVSLLLYGGMPPSMVFQKSLNTLAKRHHVRIWPARDSADNTLWLGAGTHDVSVAFDRRRMSITHRIDPRVDWEREVVISELQFAGCAATAAYVERPEAKNRDGTGIETDGRLAIVRLLPCTGEEQQMAPPAEDFRRGLPFRLAQRVILETRHYLVRGNPYYWVVRGVRRSRGRAAPTSYGKSLELAGPLTGSWEAGTAP